MSKPYRIYGAELSPYSVKVRSFCRYKGIPHRWLIRDESTLADYQKFAKLPLIPLLITPQDEGVQDSTPIMELLEERHPLPSTHPDEPATRFLSLLLEEFGDEWGNKWMFHLRWARNEDRLSAGGRIAASMAKPGDEAARLALREKVVERMSGRVWFVGSNEDTAPQIERSFLDAIALLDAHLADRPYLFGGRPAFGDFGLWAQLYESWTDPTGAAWIDRQAPRVVDWIQRMLFPRDEGPFEKLSSLSPTLEPLIAQQVGALFCPWTVANEAALAAGQEELAVELAGSRFHQKPQKYHARSLAVLRARYASIADKASVDPVLARTGCLEALQPR